MSDSAKEGDMAGSTCSDARGAAVGEVPSAPCLVYSCSGYSGAAQLANRLALELDREWFAEMSCIAGVGGGVPALVAVARSGRPIVALDGCPLQCVAACLAREGVRPALHVVLSDLGVERRRDAGVPHDLEAKARSHVRARLVERGLAPPRD